MTRFSSELRRSGLALAAAILLTAASAVAQTGRIAGTVVDDQSGAVVTAARVAVVGTQHLAVTADDGTYLIEGVPAGLHQVRAVMIGYQPKTVDVRVEDGATAHLDLRLSPSAVSLEAVIVHAEGSNASVQASLGSTVARQDAIAYARQAAPRPPFNTEEYDPIDDNPFLAVSANPRSTFSVDVDRASYGNVRRFLTQGQLPPPDAVRIEELINYFAYDYPEPEGEHPIAVHTEMGVAPWNPAHRLVRIGLQARRIATQDLPPSNLVFLIDVSGSMQPANKLPLLKDAMALLVNQLREVDRIALVVYAGAAGLVLESTPGNEKETILAALDRLQAGGTTAGGAGIRLAYDVATRHFLSDGNNRVILATDGDFNTGVSSDAEMVRLIEEKRETGVFLTVLGFGMGNYKDAKLEKLADHGNGNYAYVDNLTEAKKILVSEMAGTLFTLAKDVKIQVEFNPRRVRAHRLIGYENRLLRDEDFTDDRKDAGDVGAGHSVTAMYEIIPAGAPADVAVRTPDALRYQTVSWRAEAGGEELLYVRIRYKEPDGFTSREIAHPVRASEAPDPSGDFLFQTAVAEFGMLLRDSEHKGTTDIHRVIANARRGMGRDREGYRMGFIELAEMAREAGVGQVATAR